MSKILTAANLVTIPHLEIYGGGINVKEHGALGIGTDDTSALQSAITLASQTTSAVYFPDGLYVISASLSAFSNITFYGRSRSNCIIKSITPTLGPILYVSGNHVNISLLKFDGSYTSGSESGDFGLIDVIASSDVNISNCWLVNSLDRAIKIFDTSDSINICNSRFENHFCSIYSGSNGSGGGVPQRIHIQRCDFLNNWGTGAETGAIKLQNTNSSTRSAGHLIHGCTMSNTGQMGVELWGGIADSQVLNNQIDNVDFGISFDNTIRSIAAVNTLKLIRYIGLEAATSTADSLFAYNNVSCFDSNGNRTAAHPFESSNTRPQRISVMGNQFYGSTQPAIHFQTTDYCNAVDNFIHDCNSGIQCQGSTNIVIQNNHVITDIGMFAWIETYGSNISNINISNNIVKGSALQQNIFFYDGVGSNTIDNVVISNNDVTKLTHGGGGYPTIGSDTLGNRLTNLVISNNQYRTDITNSAQLPDNATTPFAASLQEFSIPIATKFSFTVPALSGGDQWFKVFHLDYGSPLNMLMHVNAQFQATDGRASDLTVLISSSPYGQDCNILKLPDSWYQGGVVKSIIFDNPSSNSIHEYWIRLGPTNGGTLTVAGADAASSWITSPSSVKIEPSWSSNHYEVDCANNKSTLNNRYLSTARFQGNSSTPTITANNGAGTGPSIAITGTNLAGQINLTTGTSPSSATDIFTVTLPTSFTAAPYPILVPGNANAAALNNTTGIYFSSTASTFKATINTGALAVTTQYIWYYHIIG